MGGAHGDDSDDDGDDDDDGYDDDDFYDDDVFSGQKSPRRLR